MDKWMALGNLKDFNRVGLKGTKVPGNLRFPQGWIVGKKPNNPIIQ